MQRYIARLEGRIAQRQRQSNQLSNLRLWVVLGGLVAVIGAAFSPSPWLMLPIGVMSVGAFVVILRIHRRYQRSLTHYQLWLRIKQDHRARVDLDWAAIPTSPIAPQDVHPFEIDLDLIDLNRLLDTATSREGSQRLHDWLLTATPDATTIARRQTLVRVLIPRVLFRDKLRLAATEASEGRYQRWSSAALRAWVTGHLPAPHRGAWLLLLCALAAVNIPLFVLFSAGMLPPVFLLTWVPYVFILMSQARNAFDEGLSLLNALRQFGAVLGFLERYGYRGAEPLRELCAPILNDRPSRLLRRLAWIVGAAGLQRNVIAWGMVNALIPWDVAVAWAMQRQRERLAARLPLWLETWHEVEALCSLATFAYLHPDYIFPAIEAGHVLEGRGLGHPLISDVQRVTNDFSMGALGQVVILTGSNMAGKSSFLRTLGINLSLAYAGSVVTATAFSAGLFRLYTCIRVTDSLNDGISYFYAEVKRLKGLLDALESAQDWPVFFLIDEIFRGTNNRERLLGSQAYIQHLDGAHGLGLIATHDLELVKLAEDNPLISNYHFREEVREGQMVFDYILRAGPSPTTNALKIMALEGLPVPPNVDE